MYKLSAKLQSSNHQHGGEWLGQALSTVSTHLLLTPSSLVEPSGKFASEGAFWCCSVICI